MKRFIFVMVVLCVCMNELKAESQRFPLDLNFKIPLDPAVPPLLKDLQMVLDKLRPYMVDASITEPIKLKTHVCGNGVEGGPVSCDEATVMDVKDLNVDAIEVKVLPTPTPTPKPK